VIRFVSKVLVVLVLSHHGLFQGKMRGDLRENLAQEGDGRFLVSPHAHLFVQRVDQVDQFTVFMVDFGNTGLELIAPLDKHVRTPR